MNGWLRAVALMMIVPFAGIKIGERMYYKPQPKQREFHNAIVNREKNGYRDFLYGGAARGGKSVALRWEGHRNCLQYDRIKVLLIRSSFPELERTHLRQLPFDLPPGECVYNSQKHVAYYPRTQSVFEFGYGETLRDIEQYLSADYDIILIDELTTIPFDFSYLLRSRLTASRSDFIPFFACATNPGSVAHVDVRNYFVRKTVYDRERFPKYNPAEVCFIPATVFDNQIVLRRDPGELNRLQQMSTKDQQRFLYGNWDIFEGQFFDEFFSDIHVVKPADYLSYEELLSFKCRGGMDYGQTSAVEYLAKDYNGNIIVFDEWTDYRGVRSEKARSLKAFAQERGLLELALEADTNMWIKDTFDTTTAMEPYKAFTDVGLKLSKVSKNDRSVESHRGYRVACNDAVRDYLHWQMNEDGHTFKVRPRLLIYERCPRLIETIPLLRVAENDTEDFEGGDLDHYFDAFKMPFMVLRVPKRPEDDKPKTVDEHMERYIFSKIRAQVERPKREVI